MKHKIKALVSLALCLAMMLQATVLAAEPETSDLKTSAEVAEYCLKVKETEHGTVEVKEKEKQSDEIYKYLAEEEIKVKITPEEGYELDELVMKGLDTNTELTGVEKENLYTWKATENMELKVTFKAVEQEPEETPDEKPEEGKEPEEQPDTTPETDPDEKEKPEGVKPEEVTEEAGQEIKDMLSLQSQDLLKNSLRMSARANTITYLGKVSYGGTAVGHFLVNGQIAFCMEHQKTTPPDGTSFSEQIYNNATIRKVLYYGWGGPKQWSGFGSEAQGIVCTSLTLSYYYSGPDSIIILGGPMDATIGVSAFMNYINSMPDIGSTVISLSKTYTESYLSEDKAYQRTESIKLNADSRNTITIPLPSGVTLVNETTGATGTGNVKVKGGDTFYLKAPLNMNGTWNSGKLYGSMGKFQSVVCVTDPSGYQNIGQGRYVSDPENYVQLSVKWVQMGDLKITKFLGSDEEVKNPAVGAEFTLTHQETGEQVVITANEDGIATTEDRDNYPIGRLIGGEWLVEETKTPEGFKPIDSFKVTIYGQGQVFSYIVEDKEIYAPLQVVKVDESTGNIIAASGATFKIVDENGQDVEFTSYSPDKKSFVEFTTDENGQYTLPEKLKHGKYQLVELKAPEGYLLCDPIDFEVTEYQDWETPVVLKAEDENAMGMIKIRKTDEETKDPVSGAVYQIFAKEDIVTGDGTVRAQAGELIGTMETDEQGMAQSEELFLGHYQVKESKAPAGYELDTTEHEVILKYKDQETEIVYQDVEVSDKPTEAVIKKVAAGKTDTLQGVKFNVWNEDMVSEDGLDEEMGFRETYVTDENGQISLKYLAPGNYCIQEIESIPGYVLENKIYKFTVNEQGAVIGGGQITIANDYTKIEISKQDITNGKELPGAKLEVMDKDGNVIEKWTSTEKPHMIEALPAGEYVLRETIAPNGYLVAQDINFTVKDTGEIQHVVMKDELKEGTIHTSIPDNTRNGSNTGGGVKTGDHAPIALLITIMGFALLGVAGMIVWKYKQKKEALNEEA